MNTGKSNSWKTRHDKESDVRVSQAKDAFNTNLDLRKKLHTARCQAAARIDLKNPSHLEQFKILSAEANNSNNPEEYIAKFNEFLNLTENQIYTP